MNKKRWKIELYVHVVVMMISQFCLALNESQFIIIKMFFRSIKHHWQKFIHASTMFNSLSLSFLPLHSRTCIQKKSCCSDNGTINQFDQYEKWHLELISKNIFILTLFCVMFVGGSFGQIVTCFVSEILCWDVFPSIIIQYQLMLFLVLLFGWFPHCFLWFFGFF